MNGQFTRKAKGFLSLIFCIFLLTSQGTAQTNYVDENFDTNIPASWTVNDGGSNAETWKQVTDYGGDDLDGTPFAIASSDDAGYYETMNEELITPSVDATGKAYAFLEFDQHYNDYYQDVDTTWVDVYDGTSWVNVLEQEDDDIGDWGSPDHQKIDISGMINANLQVRFRYKDSDGAGDEWAIDNVLIYGTNCPDPSNLVGLAADWQSVGLSWTENGGATEWQIEYGPTGFTQGNGTDSVTATVSPQDTIGGLSPNTTYDFYVRAVCSASDSSNWIGPVTVTTPCTPVATLEEDFNSASWTSGSPGSIDPCWSRDPEIGGEFIWSPISGATPTGSSGPDDDYPGGGKYLFTEGDNDDGATATITTPWVDASTMSVPHFKFYYHMYGADIEKLRIHFKEYGSTWMPYDSLVGEQQTGNAEPWKAYNDFLPSYSNDTIRFRIEAVQDGYGDDTDFGLDSVMVREAPSCPWVTDISANALNEDSIEVSWTEYGSPVEWQIEYGPAGFAQGNGTDTLTGTTNPDTITGLSGNNTTGYSFYVRQICGSDTSIWKGPADTVTPCPSNFSAPFSEDFNETPWMTGTGSDNTGDGISNCWSRDPVTATEFHWGTRSGSTNSSSTGPDSDASGNGNYLYTEGSNGNQGDTADLTTPWIDMSALTLPEVTYNYHFYGVEIDSFTLAIDTGQGWIGLDTLVGEDQGASSAAWLQRALILKDLAGMDSARFRFRALRGGGYECDYAIDNFAVQEAPPCPQPIDLTANVINDDSVELSWTSNGLGTEWQVTYGKTGFPTGDGTDTTILTSTLDTLTGLSMSSTRDYQLYVREICGGGDTSVWVGPVDFVTPCVDPTPAPYHESFNSTKFWDESSNAISSCWSKTDAGSGYGWEVETGETTSSNTGPNGDHPNGTGQYLHPDATDGNLGDEADLETPWIDLSTLSNPQLSFFYHFYGVEINRMDIEVNDGSGWSTVDAIKGQKQKAKDEPWIKHFIDLRDHQGDTVKVRFKAVCGPDYEGDVSIDDVSFEEMDTNNIQALEILNPASSNCKNGMSSTEVKLKLKNQGSSSQSNFDVGYSIDGGAPVSETVSGPVQSGDTITHTFTSTSAFSASGTYDLKAYTGLTSDAYRGDDTLRKQVTTGAGSMTPSSNPSTGIASDDVTMEDTLFVCGSQHDVYDCARILTLTIDSIAHEDALDELDIQLISPEGTTLDLWMQLGTGSDQIMDGLTFTDTSSTNIASATPSGGSYSGAYHPEEAAGFSKFQGERINGMWRLRIFNDDYGDTASFHGWNMRAIDPNKPQPELGPDTAICQEQNLLLDPGQDPDWSYRWDNNSTESTRPVAGDFLDTNNTYSYHVTVKDEAILNQCSNSDTIEVTVENCTGIEDREGDSDISFKVHPNPAKHRLNIRSEGADDENFRYELMDLQGRTLKSLNAEDGQRSSMNVSQLSKGVYILKGYRSSGDRPIFQKKVVIR